MDVYDDIKRKVRNLTLDALKIYSITMVNVSAPVVATTSWWLHFSAQVVA